MKRSIDDLAVFGGAPLFESVKPFGQLSVPDVDAYLYSMRDIFKRRELTGNGPMVRALEERLRKFHNVTDCIAVVNACVALVMLMRIFAGGRRGNVVVPAFSYRGIPHVVQWAGQVSRFCDVERIRHGLDPNAVAAAIDDETTAILAVCTVYGISDIDALSAIAIERNVPLLIDSVSAMGATYGGRILGSFGEAEVFSLHATKMLAGFEGGYITTNDESLARTLREQRDSGSVNATLNEMHAAMALLSLDGLDAAIAENMLRYRAYEHVCKSSPGLELVGYVNEASERYTYQMALLGVCEPWPLTRQEMVTLLRAERAMVMPYYDTPLHRLAPSKTGMVVGEMPVAEEFARRFMYLPGGAHTSIGDVTRIGDLFDVLRKNGAEISDRLRRAQQ